MLALLWARPRSLPQGVLVIYFGSAASWRPCNMVRPHQGPVPQLTAVWEAVRPMQQCCIGHKQKYALVGCDGWVIGRLVGQGLHRQSYHTLMHTTQHLSIFCSLPPWPCSWRDALCSQVCCRGNGWQAINPRCPGCLSLRGRRASPRSGTAQVPPTASAVKECSGNVVGVHAVLTGDYADRDLGNPHKLPSLGAV